MAALADVPLTRPASDLLHPAPRRSEPVVPEALPAADQAPWVFGDYLLEEQLGHGGMGVIYRATQRSLNRTVSVKLLLLGRYSSEESIRRFRREAQSAAALRHPHIVSVYEVGEHEGQPYLTLEYIDGQSLAQVLRQGPLEPRRAAEYARTIAEAIHYAHVQGVLHRDVKPSNVLLDAFGEVRLTDFGLAKRLDGSSDMTVTGEMLGSPNYLSPEQAGGRNREVGPPADIYGIGALLYELLTGRPPFMAPSLQDTLFLIRDSDPVPPTSLNPDLPRDLEIIVLKCLEKDPAKRYATAADLAIDLDRFLRNLPILARPTPAVERAGKWIRRHRMGALLLSTVILSLLALSAGSWWFTFRVNRAREETEAANRRLSRNLFVREWNDAEQLLDERKPLPALTWFARVLRREPTHHVAAARLMTLLENLTLSIPAASPLVHPGPVYTASFSSSGLQLVTACADGGVRIWTWKQPAPHQQLLRTFEKPAACFVPGSDDILVADYHGVSRWRPDGTLLHETRHPSAGFLSWQTSRDGRRAVLISTERPPVLWDLATLQPVPREALAHDRLRTVALSGDGRFLLRPLLFGNNTDLQLGAWELATDRMVWLGKLPEIPGIGYLYSARFSDDGTRLAICRWGGRISVWRLDLPLAAEGTVPVIAGPPIQELSLGPISRAESLQFVDQNRHLLIATTDGMAHLWDLATGRFVPDHIEHAGQINATAIATNQSVLATASVDGLVSLWDLRAQRPEPLVIGSSNEVWDVAFAPDSSWFVTAGQPAATVHALPQGTQRFSLPMTGGSLISRVAVSPDGQRIATTTEHGHLRIWNGTTGEPVTPELAIERNLHDLSFTPEGRSVCVGAPGPNIHLLDTETGQPRQPKLTAEPSVVSTLVTADPARLVTGTVHGEVHFWSMPFLQPLATHQHHRGVVWTVRASRDGRRIATASGDQSVLIWNNQDAAVVREFRSDKAFYCAEFSPDGRQLVTGSADRTARIWDLTTGRQVSEIMRHPGGVWYAQFSSDGRVVATGDDSGFARLWDAHTGLPLGNWLRSGASLRRVRLSPDNHWIATVSADHFTRVWPVFAPEAPAPAWLSELAEALAGRRLDDEGNITPVSFQRWNDLRTALLAAPAEPGDFYAAWARWFLEGRLASPCPPPPVPGDFAR